uniref:SRPBCC family protein n=1 Tax=Escherichia coli TaxID=562 RepID=UPI001952BFB7
HITYPGYEHVKWQARVKEMVAPRLFSFTWHPYAVDPAVDYGKETPTLVEFRLEPITSGTRLTVIESGFNAVPGHRRAEAFRMNDGGWAEQV